MGVEDDFEGLVHAIAGKKGVGHMVVHYKWDTEERVWNIVGSVVGDYMGPGYISGVEIVRIGEADLLEFVVALAQ